MLGGMADGTDRNYGDPLTDLGAGSTDFRWILYIKLYSTSKRRTE